MLSIRLIADKVPLLATQVSAKKKQNCQLNASGIERRYYVTF